MSELPELSARPREAHKGDFGTCLIVGGSHGMTGAIVLAARAALRSGVGLCRVAVPLGREAVIPMAVTEATSIGLAECEGAIASRAAEPVLEAARSADAVAIGPGMSRAGEVSDFVERVLPSVPVPLVVDADALNVLGCKTELLNMRDARTVITPHPGEAARMLELESAADVQRDRLGVAGQLAARTGAVVVLKGAGTLVMDGERSFCNQSGNPGMATGGSGDVLTGMIVALLAQGLEPFDASVLAVVAHGRAGDHAARDGSQAGLIAGDIVDRLPVVWRDLGSD